MTPEEEAAARVIEIVSHVNENTSAPEMWQTNDTITFQQWHDAIVQMLNERNEWRTWV